jgi:GT2 family glycosyltransferase
MRGDSARLLKSGEDFIGANFALTRKAISAVGLFNTALGRKGHSLLSGEDTEYSDRLWNQGFKIAYSAEGYIYHRVHPDRLTYRWIAKRYFWAGVTNTLKRGWFYPFSVIPRFFASSLLVIFGLIIFNQNRYVRSSFRVANACGAFYGWYLRVKQQRAWGMAQRAERNSKKGR